MAKILVTDAPMPIDDVTLAAAHGAGAGQIVHVDGGFPDWLTALGIDTPGVHDIPDPPNPLVPNAEAARDDALDLYQLCRASGIPWSDSWVSYMQALNAIISTGVGELPNAPERPSGL